MGRFKTISRLIGFQGGILLGLALASGIAWAATATWNGTYEAIPANTDAVSLGDDNIRDLKENIRDYLETEINIGTSGDNNGRMREGSARAFYMASDPTTLNGSNPAGAATNPGSNTIGSTDDGRLLRRSDTGELKVWTGSAWTQAITTLTGTINLLSTPRFATTAGADAFNPLAFTIRNIVVDTTLDTAGCLDGSTNFIANPLTTGQTFGDAGTACFTTGTIDLSARSTTSRGIIIAQVATVPSSSTSTCQFAVYRDSLANQVGPIGQNLGNSATGYQSNTIVTYVTGLTAATHEFALHVADSGAGTCNDVADPNGGSLIWIDLGPEY